MQFIDDALLLGASGFIVRSILALLAVVCLIKLVSVLKNWVTVNKAAMKGGENKGAPFPMMSLAVWAILTLGLLLVLANSYAYNPRASLNVPTVPVEIQERIHEESQEAPAVIEKVKTYAPDVPTAEEVEQQANEDASSVVDSFKALPDAEQAIQDGDQKLQDDADAIVDSFKSLPDNQ